MFTTEFLDASPTVSVRSQESMLKNLNEAPRDRIKDNETEIPNPTTTDSTDASKTVEIDTKYSSLQDQVEPESATTKFLDASPTVSVRSQESMLKNLNKAPRDRIEDNETEIPNPTTTVSQTQTDSIHDQVDPE
jgi:hypothetical protein